MLCHHKTCCRNADKLITVASNTTNERARFCSDSRTFFNIAYCGIHLETFKRDNKSAKFSIWKGFLFKEMDSTFKCDHKLCRFASTKFFSNGSYCIKKDLMKFCEFHSYVMANTYTYKEITRDEYTEIFMKIVMES